MYLEGGQFLDPQSRQVALLGQCSSGERLDYLPALMGRAEVVVMNGLDLQVSAIFLCLINTTVKLSPLGTRFELWGVQQVTVAESMVEAFQDSSTALFAVAHSAKDAQVYLEVAEKGTDGVVLHTEDPAQIYALKAYLKGRREAFMGVRLVKAAVTDVEPVGLGDRVCVDLCNLLHPGEGLLVCLLSKDLTLFFDPRWPVEC